MQYDYIIVGAGIFGATFARLATDEGKKCLIIDKRSHIAGNCYTENIESIQVHVYGPHIFHTNDEKIWAFVNQFATFNSFINSPVAVYKGKLFSLPFSMYTFNQMWGVITPDEAVEKIKSQLVSYADKPKNLEEQALSLVGTDIYETLIRGYTKKQWKRDPVDLPAEIIKRLPVRFTYDNNYFNDKYQGIPIGGYTKMMQNMLAGVDVKLETDFFSDRGYYSSLGKNLVFTGKIDEFYAYEFGELEYRALRFETEVLNKENFQGNAVVNYTEEHIPYTRSIEHNFFDWVNSPKTVVTKEYPEEWTRDSIPYYPIGDAKNTAIYKKYQEKSKTETNVIFGGRLSEYRYYDMHQVIGSAFAKYKLLHK